MKKSVHHSLSGGDAPLSCDSAAPGAGAAESAETDADRLSVNALLQSELQTLRAENGSLATTVSQLRAELAETRRRWESERLDLAAAGGSDTAAARILELSRRQRHLTAQLEAERTRCRRLEALARAPPTTPPTAAPPTRGDTSAPADGARDEETIPQLKERLKDTTRRLVEARNHAQVARRELKLAERLLQQEVGESASVQGLLSAGAGWRGRAQQIVALRAQLAELQSSLAAASSSADGTANVARSETRLSTADTRVRSHIAGLEREQRSAARQAEERRQRLAEENGHLKQKLEQARSRSTVQAQELSKLRETVTRLTEKGNNDNEMIEALTAQLRMLETKLAEGERAAAAAASARHPPPLHGHQVSLLRAQLAAKDERIGQLETELATRPQPEVGRRSPSPAPAELSALRRRCLEATFLLEAAATERARLLEQQRQLQTHVAELERAAEATAAELLLEREAVAGSRRECERLQQMLGRGRRSAQPRTAATDELEPLRAEVERLKQQLELHRQGREQDLAEYERTMEEARAIFCRGLQEAASGFEADAEGDRGGAGET